MSMNPKIDVETVLLALNAIGAIAAATEDFEELYHQIVDLFDDEADQATLKAALADIQADNDEGHARLQAKLAKIANP